MQLDRIKLSKTKDTDTIKQETNPMESLVYSIPNLWKLVFKK